MNALAALKEAFDYDKASLVLDCYLRLYDTMKTRAKMVAAAPAPHCNDTLSLCDRSISRDHSALIDALSHDFTEAETEWLISHPEIKSRRRHIWHWLSLAESAMEKHYSKSLDGDLREFFNYNGYDRLVDAELKQLGFPLKQPALKNFESIAFVGAGPLPLSAILIHQKTGLPVTCIDCDKEAAELGSKFVDKCGLAGGISYRHTGGDQPDYCIHPIIFIAGLVQNKESVVCRVGMCRGANTIAIRSAMGIGALLDKPLSSQLTELLYIFFDRHTPAEPPFFNATWFSSWPFWRFRPDSTVDQIIRPPRHDPEESLRFHGAGRRNAFSYNL